MIKNSLYLVNRYICLGRVIYPIPEREEPADVSHIVSEGSEDSIADDKE